MFELCYFCKTSRTPAQILSSEAHPRGDPRSYISLRFYRKQPNQRVLKYCKLQVKLWFRYYPSINCRVTRESSSAVNYSSVDVRTMLGHSGPLKYRSEGRSKRYWKAFAQSSWTAQANENTCPEDTFRKLKYWQQSHANAVVKILYGLWGDVFARPKRLRGDPRPYLELSGHFSLSSNATAPARTRT